MRSRIRLGRSRAAFVFVASSLLLVGCPSKSGEQKDAQTSSGAPSGQSAATGPLANLETSPYLKEVWIDNEGGRQLGLIYFARENLRVSSECRKADGAIGCDAVRQIRGGMPVELARRSLSGSASAGTKACQKLGHKLVNAHNSVGAEDGFCQFPDGSLISTGGLEQYGLRLLE